ncbi:hypothetical protein CYMTET_50975 [Cymbomonas tetramitiformis]|uniref:Ion transport domain-containing protein n=1 Tax=Cymbomonas tetramitiformis TaxID=36881 RepID=A0AAE0BN52_9CHLO|nr:hypothetical protein CYMTET_50975 [Cymbomonas tetramitiformis]
MDSLKDSEAIFILEFMFTIIFTVEFLMRVLSRLSYPHDLFFDPMAWGDFLAILPFYVELILDREDLNFLRIARVFRIVKMSRYYYGSQILARAMDLSVAPLCVTMFFFSLTVILFGTSLYYTEGYFEGSYVERPDEFNSIPKCMWFIMLISTAGVGEEVPTSSSGKACMLSSIICGIFFIAMPLAVIGNNFTKVWDEKERMLLIIALRSKMDEMQIDELAVYQTFVKQDVERSGTLDYFQFKSALFELVPDCEPGHLKQVFKSFDVEKENEISLNALWGTMFPEMRDEYPDDDYDEDDEGPDTEAAEGQGTQRTMESGVTSHMTPDGATNAISKKMTHRDIARLVGTIEKSLQQNRVSNIHVEERIANLEKSIRVQAQETEDVVDKLSADMQRLVAVSAQLFKRIEMMNGIDDKRSMFSQSVRSAAPSHESRGSHANGTKWASNFMTTLGLWSKGPSDFATINEEDDDTVPAAPVISPTFLPTFNFFMDPWDSGRAMSRSPEHQEEYMDKESYFSEEDTREADYPPEAGSEAGNAQRTMEV